MACVQSLNQLSPGRSARVAGLSATGAMRRRLLDIGLVRGAVVECVGCSPFGDPKAFLIKDAVIALRGEDCATVRVCGREEGKWD